MSRNNVLLQQNICCAMICLRSEEFLIYANICHALANLKRNKWTIISGACTITTQFKPAILQIRYSCKSPNSGRLTNVQQNSFLRGALTCVYQTGLPFCNFWQTRLFMKKNIYLPKIPRNAKRHMITNIWDKTVIKILIYFSSLVCVFSVKINIWITFLLLKIFYIN